MNPLTQIQNTRKRSLAEIDLGLSDHASWHDRYSHSAYIFAGNVAEKLTEGDVLTIFSQYGEVVDLSMPRDKDTKRHRGFAFLAYRDQRSTVLAVDNLSGTVVAGRTLRVEHVDRYERRIEAEAEGAEGSGANAAPIGAGRGAEGGPSDAAAPSTVVSEPPPARAPWELEGGVDQSSRGPGSASAASPLDAPTSLAELRARAAAKRGRDVENERDARHERERGDDERREGRRERERERSERREREERRERGERRERSERRDRDKRRDGGDSRGEGRDEDARRESNGDERRRHDERRSRDERQHRDERRGDRRRDSRSGRDRPPRDAYDARVDRNRPR